MKTESIKVAGIFGTLLSAALLIFYLGLQRELPRFRLKDGGEFRVLQIRYTPSGGKGYEHHLGRSEWRWWLWRRLPPLIRSQVPMPDYGIGGMWSTRPAISIWWARFDEYPVQPGACKAGDVLMTLDSGKEINLGWPEPSEDYRQIFITNPPADSKRLRFHVPVRDESVEFTIDNPAYRP